MLTVVNLFFYTFMEIKKETILLKTLPVWLLKILQWPDQPWIDSRSYYFQKGMFHFLNDKRSTNIVKRNLVGLRGST